MTSRVARAALLAATSLVVGCNGLQNLFEGSGSSGGSAAPGKPAPMEERCSPDHELSDEERYQIQIDDDEGKNPCPMWAAPELRLDGTSMSLNGQPLDRDGMAKGNVVHITQLFERLKTNRERWKQFHPADPFPGKLSVIAETGADTGQAISALVTATHAGYPNLSVTATPVSVDFAWFVAPGPSIGGPGSGGDEIFLEPLEGGGYQVGVTAPPIKSGRLAVWHRTKASNDTELAAWFEEHCKGAQGQPCSRKIRIRPLGGPLDATLSVVRTVLAMPLFAETKPAFVISFQCRSLPGARFDVSTLWGPRFPDEGPCSMVDSMDERLGGPPPAALEGRLPADVIQRVVRQNFGSFRACYEQALRTNPSLQGRVTVRFTVTPQGEASNISTGGDIPDAGVRACVAKAFEKVVFPTSTGGPVTVSYPIVFTPG